VVAGPTVSICFDVFVYISLYSIWFSSEFVTHVCFEFDSNSVFDAVGLIYCWWSSNWSSKNWKVCLWSLLINFFCIGKLCFAWHWRSTFYNVNLFLFFRRLCVDHENVKPDLLILGKALSGGVYPVSLKILFILYKNTSNQEQSLHWIKV